jgi:hypothetical protein
MRCIGDVLVWFWYRLIQSLGNELESVHLYFVEKFGKSWYYVLLMLLVEIEGLDFPLRDTFVY